MATRTDDWRSYVREALLDGTAKEKAVNLGALSAAAAGKPTAGGPVRLILPWPPSVNTYYRNIPGKTLISEQGREYRKAVVRAVAQSQSLFYWDHGVKGMEGPLRLEAEFAEPDKRRRDLDNLLKAMLDALQKAGVYENDSQIRQIEARFAPLVEKGGAVDVTISKIIGTK